MKVRVTTDRFDYMGLLKGSVHKVESTCTEGFTGDKLYRLVVFGKSWFLFQSDCEEIVEDNFPYTDEKLLDMANIDLKREECRSPYCECDKDKCSTGKVDMRGTVAEVKLVSSSTLTTKPVKEQGSIKPNSPIKFDGGSSPYYNLELPAWLLYTLNQRQKEGKCYIKTEEMISAFFGNDFDRGNIIKSLVRCQGLQDTTGGKTGNSVEYECNKMIYSVNKIKEKK